MSDNYDDLGLVISNLSDAECRDLANFLHGVLIAAIGRDRTEKVLGKFLVVLDDCPSHGSGS